MTRIVLAIALLVASLSFAAAQTSTFYGPAGRYQGQARTFGNTTTYYGSSGQYLGQTNTFGNTTTVYGRAGQYKGGSINTYPAPRAPRPCFGLGC